MEDEDEDYVPSDTEIEETESDDDDYGEESSAEEHTARPHLEGDDTLRERVTALIHKDARDGCKACLKGKAGEIDTLLRSLMNMEASEKKVSILTALGVLSECEEAASQRQRGKGERKRFVYYLPFVGQVCLQAFADCYDTSTASLTRLRKRVKDGYIYAQPHGNRGNDHHQTIDVDWLVGWFRDYAATVGEVVPLRVRRQVKTDGKTVTRVVFRNHTLLPSYLTWSKLHEEMQLSVAASLVRRVEPAEPTFRMLLQQHCPDIAIRSPRDNVCDLCTIYKNQMKGESLASDMELLGKHTEEARQMRVEYKADKASVSDTHALLTIDFAQNISLPHAVETPSQWYFMSLIGVSVFGVHSANEERQTNFLYSERCGGKGSNEVMSMINWFVEPATTTYRKLTIYADNCGGQNKNNHVLKYLLLLTHVGYLEEVHYKFFVRGHTKNSCDRGFGMLKKKLARTDCWSLEQLATILETASIDTHTELLDSYPSPFSDYKNHISELYRNLPAIQKYQLFSMYHAKPGVVECRQTPSSPSDVSDIRKSYDGIRVTPERAEAIYTSTPPLAAPTPNPEKVNDIYKNIRPYVPAEYQSSSLYAPPTSEQIDAAQETKRARVTHRAGEKARKEGVATGVALQAANVAAKADEIARARTLKRKKTAQAMMKTLKSRRSSSQEYEAE